MNNEVLEQLKREYNETFKRLQELGEVIYNCADIDTNHCGQDAEEEFATSINELLGMEVVAVGGIATKCKGCSFGCDNCVKVELKGGDYICLAKPEQDEKPLISFDEEDTKLMDNIREKTEAFMDYLDSIVTNKKEQCNERLLYRH